MFRQAHQLQPDGVHQGVPARHDHVVGNAHRGPALAVIRPFDEHAHFGGGALARLQHAHFVVGQAHVGHLRIDRRQTLAQAHVQSVEGAVAGGGGGVHAILRAHGDIGGRAGVTRGGGFGRNLVTFHFEEMHSGIERLAHQ